MSRLPREISSSSDRTSSISHKEQQPPPNNNHTPPNNNNTTTTSSSSCPCSSAATTTTTPAKTMTAKTAQPPVMLMGNGINNTAGSLNSQTTMEISVKNQYNHRQQHQNCGTQVLATCGNSNSSIPRSLPLTNINGAVVAAAAAAAATGVEIRGFSSASSSSSVESLGFSVPFNFAMVWPGVYRSSFPKEEHFPYLQFLGLKTILTLVPEEYPEENVKFMMENGIQHFQIGMHGNKSTLAKIPHERISQAVSIVLDKRNHPILIHCNKGKHRTGCVVGCVRKVQNWATPSVIDEYRHYSAPKNRIMDEQLLQTWDGKHLAGFAAQQGGWSQIITDPPPPRHRTT